MAALKAAQNIQFTLAIGTEMTLHKGAGTNDTNNIYLDLDQYSTFRHFVLSTSDEIFVTDINNSEFRDPMPIASSAVISGFQLDFGKTNMSSFSSIKLQGGDAAAVVGVFVC